MELVLFIGIPASGKSSFYRQRLATTHLRINLDMLATRHREQRFYELCLETQLPCVIDNTNPTREDRARYIPAAQARKFKITGYLFQTSLDEALARNAGRTGKQCIPERGIRSIYRKLEPPDWDEGFDQLFQVRLDEESGFEVTDWEPQA